MDITSNNVSPSTLTCSIVLYKNPVGILEKAIISLIDSNFIVKIYLVDNSPTDELKLLAKLRGNIAYIKTQGNIGFGRGHNLVLKDLKPDTKYHLVLNPDVSFNPKVITELVKFMDQNTDVGLILPKVLNFESELQYVCRRLPSPLDLILRRLKLNFVNRLFAKRLDQYEMKDMDYNRSFEAPSLSGCFMLFRVEALKKIGLFDERYFMYMEDVDISRRVHQHFKTVYYPKVQIFHGHARESYNLNKLLLIHVVSAIKYFNKWGWFFDRERKTINSSIGKN